MALSMFGTSGSVAGENQTPADGASVAAKFTRCGKIKANPNGHFRVSKKGRTSCRGARRLMDLFLNQRQGTKHGGPSSAETYWSLYGWNCGTGAGGGGCMRHRGRDRTLAEWTR